MTCIPGEDVGNLSLILEHVSLLITIMFHLQIINHARVTFQKTLPYPPESVRLFLLQFKPFFPLHLWDGIFVSVCFRLMELLSINIWCFLAFALFFGLEEVKIEKQSL